MELYNDVKGGENHKARLPLDELKKTNKGYIRIRRNGKTKMLHVLVWEENFGEIPDGYQVHHKNGNKTDNQISNLMLVDALTHKRLHTGCKLINGIWFKPCKTCGELKACNTENWYLSRGWINGKECKTCYIKRQIKKDKERKERAGKNE